MLGRWLQLFRGMVAWHRLSDYGDNCRLLITELVAYEKGVGGMTLLQGE